jgi:hypothetical protein
VVDEVVLEQVASEYFGFSMPNPIPPTIIIYSYYYGSTALCSAFASF